MGIKNLSVLEQVNIQDALTVRSMIVTAFRMRGASREAVQMAEKVGKDFLVEVFSSGVSVRDERHMDYEGHELDDYFGRCARVMLIVFLESTEAKLEPDHTQYSNWAVFQEFRKIVRSL